MRAPCAWDVSPCDNHAQRALLLMEIPLADAALRSGAARDYDERVRSLESRARQALGCTPRESFIWLVLFGLETGHGVLDQHAFDLLAMSYETSPNEAWIATRRIALAIPVVLAAPGPMQQKILGEFQDLVRTGFIELPARAYLRASGPIRALLQITYRAARCIPPEGLRRRRAETANLSRTLRRAGLLLAFEEHPTAGIGATMIYRWDGKDETFRRDRWTSSHGISDRGSGRDRTPDR